MARGRMLNKSVSASRKFHLLPDDTCRLLATWTIGHLDKNGVFYGDPVMVKSLIFPRRGDISIEQVEMYIEAMREASLIILFEAQGQIWQYWVGFADNQTGLRPDRETTDFPEPVTTSGVPIPPKTEEPPISNDDSIPEIFRHDAGNNPAQSPPNRKEDNLKELLPPPESGSGLDEELSEVSTVYQENIGFISPIIADELKDLLDTYGKEWLKEAIVIAVKANKRKLNYVAGILNKWRIEGKGPPGGNGQDSPSKETFVFIDRQTGEELKG